MKFPRKPLLHFLLLGARLFVVFDLLNQESSQEPGKIVVTTHAMPPGV